MDRQNQLIGESHVVSEARLPRLKPWLPLVLAMWIGMGTEALCLSFVCETETVRVASPAIDVMLTGSAHPNHLGSCLAQSNSVGIAST